MRPWEPSDAITEAAKWRRAHASRTAGIKCQKSQPAGKERSREAIRTTAAGGPRTSHLAKAIAEMAARPSRDDFLVGSTSRPVNLLVIWSV